MPPAFTHQQLHQWMQLALHQAELAQVAGDVPVGAVMVNVHGDIIAQAHNTREANHDPCGHAEILAMRHVAQQLGQWRLPHCTLVVTLEPCLMCASALVQAKVGTVVFGAADPQQGGLGGQLDARTLTPGANAHTTTVISGICETDCKTQLTQFFKQHRL